MSRSPRRLNALSNYAKCHTRNSAYTCVQTLGMYFHPTVTVNLLFSFFHIFVCLSQFCASHVSDAKCKGLIFVHTLNFVVLGLLPMHCPTYFFLEISYIFCLFSNYHFVAMLLICVFISALSCLIMFREIADPQSRAYFRFFFHVCVLGMMALEHEDSRIYDTYD